MTRATGNLLVTSAPQNCLVEIDGKAQVKATPLLRIDGLAPGDHRISFNKTGFDRVYGLVVVEPGVDVAVRGDLLSGKLETFAEGEGSLRVISKPALCTVQFMGKTHDKTHEKLNVSHIPAGAHKIVVSWDRRQLSTDVVITEGQRAVVIVSFIRGDEPFVVTYEPE